MLPQSSSQFICVCSGSSDKTEKTTDFVTAASASFVVTPTTTVAESSRSSHSMAVLYAPAFSSTSTSATAQHHQR